MEFNSKELFEINSKFPFTFFPLYDLQIHVIQDTFGEFWWEAHKAKVKDDVTEEMAKEANMWRKKQMIAKLALKALNEEMVQKRMEIFYYLTPWVRGHERRKVYRIAVIEEELDDVMKSAKNNIQCTYLKISDDDEHLISILA